MALVVAVLLVGSATTASVVSARRAADDVAAEAAFELAVQEVEDRLVNGLRSYASVLEGTGSYMAASQHVSQAEWMLYVTSRGLERYPGMDGLGFIAFVPWDQLDAFTADLVADVPEAQVSVEGPAHDLMLVRHATSGSQYLGIDLSPDRARRETGLAALERRSVTMTPPVVRVTDPTAATEPGSFAMYSPVFAAGANDVPPGTLLGWTAAVFDVGDLIDVLDLEGGGVDLALFTGGEATAESGTGSSRPLAEMLSDERLTTSVVELHGRTWTLGFTPRAGWFTPPGDTLPLSIAGGLATLAVAGAAALGASQRTRLRREVRAATSTSDATNARLQDELGFQHALLGSLQVGVAACNPDGALRSFNLDPANLPEGELPGNIHDDAENYLYDPSGRQLPVDEHPLVRALRGESFTNFQMVFQVPDGERHDLMVNAQPVTTANGGDLGAVAVFHDVTQLKEAQAELARQALHDELTGLPNRTLFLDRLNSALTRSARSGERHAVLFCDLDGFKQVNDEFGHDAGDRVLQTVADRIRTRLRASDTAARFGGDEFVLLCEAVGDQHDVEAMVCRLAEAVNRPFPMGSTTRELSLSIGVAVSHPGDDAEELLRVADAAMYRQKRGNVRLPAGGAPASPPGPGLPAPDGRHTTPA